MKKVLFTVLAAALMLIGADAFAQGKYGADSAECVKYLSYYKEYFKQGNYEDAVPNWRVAYKLCPPTASYNLYVDGATLVRRLISKNRNPLYKEALVDTLMTLYDIRIENYPKYAVSSSNNKGIDLSNYVKDDYARLHNEYTKIIAANGTKTKAQLFLFDLNAAVELYKLGSLTPEDIINIYQTNLEYLSGLEAKTEFEAGQNAKIKSDLETLFISSKVASCDNLIELFTPRYEADPENAELLANILKMMNTTEECTDNDLYLNAATSMYKVNPSYLSAYALFQLNQSKGNVDDAIRYMEEAIAYEESDARTDAEYAYKLAAFCFKSGKASKAYDYARKVASYDPSSEYLGKSYFLIGQIWLGVSCGGNEITSRSPYWVAADYFSKAKAADESLSEEAGKYISTCARYYPEASDAFMYDITKGQSYTVNCGGMSATTTVRVQ